MFILSMCCMLAHAQFSNVSPGDIVDINGTKAIVYQVDETGEHGVAMSVKCLRGVKDPWCTNDKLSKSMPMTTNTEDGLANTKEILAFAESHDALDEFPVFKWCKQLGEGWYIPSLKELESFVNFWLGNEQTIDWDSEEETEIAFDDSKPYYKQINMKMVEAGGVPFINNVFTSTITSEGKVHVFWFNRQKNSWSFWKISKERLNKYVVGRAFYRF